LIVVLDRVVAARVLPGKCDGARGGVESSLGSGLGELLGTPETSSAGTLRPAMSCTNLLVSSVIVCSDMRLLFLYGRRVAPTGWDGLSKKLSRDSRS
jgi:hypothetical protein